MACTPELCTAKGVDSKPVVAALQLYSDKTLVAMKGQSAHPVRITFLNIAYGMRIISLKDVALLPELKASVQCPGDL
jgi:hypothetical protein